MSIVLSTHNGDLGRITGWVDCAACVAGRGIHNPAQPGWFAIRKGDPHYIDARTAKHYHRDCGEALIKAGDATWEGRAA